MLAQSLCTCAGTITYFIPTLMAALGYKGNEVQYVRSTTNWRFVRANHGLDDYTNL
jgi:hypothetical protein